MNKKNISWLLGLSLFSSSFVYAANNDIDFSALTPAQNAQLDQKIESYLLKNPDMLLKMSNLLQEAENLRIKEKIMSLKSDILAPESTAVVKGTNAKVTIVEFFDYNCVYCSQVYPELKKVMSNANNADVNFAFKEFPILAEKLPESNVAAATGLKVLNEKGADAYLIYHNSVYDTKHVEGKLTEADIETAAKKAGSEKVNAEEMKKYMALIEKNISLREPVGIRGTPYFLVIPENGNASAMQIIGGATSAEQIQAVIDDVKSKS